MDYSPSWLERQIAVIAPRWALHRHQARLAMRAYEAAAPSRLRKPKRSSGDANRQTRAAGPRLRDQARWLEENYDLARGVLNVLVNNTIGSSGIQIEPQPRRRDGEIHEPLADQLTNIMADWDMRPEVTWEMDTPAMQRLVARTWLRDGECFAQHLEGPIIGLQHGTQLAYSLELLEPDYCPLDLTDPARGIVQGVERNAWGRPRAYHIYYEHPGNTIRFRADLKAIPARQMMHLKLVDRLHQVRGVSAFASTLTRLDDIKDYEESERVAARVSAALTAYVKRGSPELFEGGTVAEGDRTERRFDIAPGMVYDGLEVGEDIGVIQSNRPSALLTDFRDAMIRGVAAGTSATYSSIARDYNGTYSAQRQELVEGYVGYGVIAAEFAARWARPCYRRRVALALLQGLIEVPPDVDETTLFDGTYHSQAMPWIDPDREARGNERLSRAGFESEEMIIRKRGRRPADVRAELLRHRRWARENDMILSSDAATPTAGGSHAQESGQAGDAQTDD